MKNVVYKRKPLGNKRFIWKQKEFALSTFNCIGKDMGLAIKNCKDAGFNLLELGWANHNDAWKAVDICEKYGIDLIFQDLSIFGGMMHLHDNRPVDDDNIRKMVEKLKVKKYTVGFYVWDEPHSDWLFKEARRQSDILNENAPDALLFSVFPPSYNSGPTWDNGRYYAAFEQYIKEVSPPVLSIDCYPIGDYGRHYPGLVYTDEKQLDDSPMWLDLTVARNLAREYELPFWFYYQACKVFNTEKITFPMIRMMMYSGALYGAKGLQNYTVTGICGVSDDEKQVYPEKETVIVFTGEKGEFFEEQKKINQEFKMLGNTLMALSNRAVYHSSDLKIFGKYDEIYKRFADTISESKILAKKLPQRTSIGEFYDDYGNEYLLILNRDFDKNLEAEIPLSGKFNLYEVSKVDGKQHLAGKNTEKINVSLSRGDAILLRIQPSGDEMYSIEYTL